jgi:hypothetical protein
VHEVDVDALAATLRAVAADPAERARRGAAAARRALDFGWDRAALAAEQALARLESEALPLARHVVPAALDTRGTAVLFAPDWQAPGAWSEALSAWAGAVGRDADATLVLAVAADQAETVTTTALARLAELGHPESSLPDLLLHPMAPGELPALVAACDAVLLDAAQASARPPALCRRALRVLAAGDVAPFATRLARLARAA